MFNVGGRLYAVRNVCPHQGAPLCRGTVSGTMLPSAPQEYVYGMEDRILRCPWHGWEFHLDTGESLTNAKRRVRTYPVTIDGDSVFIDV